MSLFRFAVINYRMSLLDCLNMDIDDFLDYMEFDLVRYPLDMNGGDAECQEQI